MTPEYVALFVIAFLAILTGGAYVMGLLLGPDPDLEPDSEEVIRFAPCGEKDCHNPHPYRHWVGRQR